MRHAKPDATATNRSVIKETALTRWFFFARFLVRKLSLGGKVFPIRGNVFPARALLLGVPFGARFRAAHRAVTLRASLDPSGFNP